MYIWNNSVELNLIDGLVVSWLGIINMYNPLIVNSTLLSH